MLNRFFTLLALLSPMVLSACANSLTVNEVNLRSDSTVLLRESALRGEVETIVVGSLFENANDRMVEAVTHAISASYHGPSITFTGTPRYNPAGIRMVFLMNAPHGLDARHLCTSTDTVSPATSSGNLRVLGALCRGEHTFRSALARGMAPSSLNDPLFASYVSAITAHLLSPRETDRDCGDWPCSGG